MRLAAPGERGPHWRASRTPEGPATLAIESRDAAGEVRAQAWGPVETQADLDAAYAKAIEVVENGRVAVVDVLLGAFAGVCMVVPWASQTYVTEGPTPGELVSRALDLQARARASL